MSDNSTQETQATAQAEVATPPEATTTSATLLGQSKPEAAITAPEQVAEAPTESEYSYVPPKFLRDGKPDFEGMSKSYIALEKKIGQKGHLAPESIDAYEYKPETLQLDDNANKAFKEDALKAGLSPQQYQWALQQYEKAHAETAQTPAKAEAYLKESWGDAFDSNMANALKAYDTYVGSHIPMDSIGNNPLIIDVLARVGAELGEDKVVNKSKASSAGVSKADIEALMKEPDYWKNSTKQAQVSEWYAKNS